MEKPFFLKTLTQQISIHYLYFKLQETCIVIIINICFRRKNENKQNKETYYLHLTIHLK